MSIILRQDEGTLEEFPEEILKALSRVEFVSRIDITKPNQHFPGQILAADLLVFAPGASLQIGDSSMPFVAILAKELVFPGGANQVELSTPISNLAKGPNGATGENGGNGKYPLEQINGEKGSVGKPVLPGNRGNNAPLFAFLTNRITFVAPPVGQPTPVVIISPGSDGGDGGDGGIGGDGGDGFDAIAGFPMDVDGGQSIVCVVPPRPGGAAGYGGDGSSGGIGGDGGDGGDVWLIGTAASIEETKKFTILAPAGLPGEGGSGRQGGQRGNPGKRSYSVPSCGHGKAGQKGKPGRRGLDGRDGQIGQEKTSSTVVILNSLDDLL